MKKHVLNLLFILLFLKTYSQFSTVDLMGDKSSIEIPFEYEQGFIIVKVFLNGVLPMNFIFDTGAENTILLKKQYADIMMIPMNEVIQIIGSDRRRTQPGFISRRVPFKLVHGELFKMDIVVLEEEGIDFTNIIGREIDGILGANMLIGSIFEINYRRKYIKFYKQDYFKPPKLYKRESVDVVKQRPYLNSVLSIDDEHDSNIKLLLDTGASVHVMLDEESHPDLVMPDTIIDSRLGEGLGGTLSGFLGSISRIDLMDHTINDLPVYFQKKDTLFQSNPEYKKYRNGIVGNIFLERNHIILDYTNNTLYYKPLKNKRKPFRFNKSGLIVFAVGPNLEEYIIKYVIPDSAGDQAGLKQGDVIKSLNYIPHVFLNMNFINHVFTGKEGKRIRLKVYRNGKSKLFKFSLFNKFVSKKEFD